LAAGARAGGFRAGGAGGLAVAGRGVAGVVGRKPVAGLGFGVGEGVVVVEVVVVVDVGGTDSDQGGWVAAGEVPLEEVPVPVEVGRGVDPPVGVLGVEAENGFAAGGVLGRGLEELLGRGLEEGDVVPVAAARAANGEGGVGGAVAGGVGAGEPDASGGADAPGVEGAGLAEGLPGVGDPAGFVVGFLVTGVGSLPLIGSFVLLRFVNLHRVTRRCSASARAFRSSNQTSRGSVTTAAAMRPRAA
jgi:hypothetical protein